MEFTWPRHAGDESLQQSQSDHPAVIEVANYRHGHAHHTADEIGKAEDELRSVLGRQNAARELRHPVQPEERTENERLLVLVPLESVAFILDLETHL